MPKRTTDKSSGAVLFHRTDEEKALEIANRRVALLEKIVESVTGKPMSELEKEVSDGE